MLELPIRRASRPTIEMPLNQGPIVRMSSLQDSRQGGPRVWIEIKNPEGLFGPKDLGERAIPAEAARMTDSLRLRQVHFAALERGGRSPALRPQAGDNQKNRQE